VLPGTGGLTRLTDKRGVRRDVADYLSTKPEGVGGRRAVTWRLVDEVVPRSRWHETVSARARELAAGTDHPRRAPGVGLPPLVPTRTDGLITYGFVSARLDRPLGVATITVQGPDQDPSPDADGVHD
jgi:benzoyl-CoA-dihydrodiol lyase